MATFPEFRSCQIVTAWSSRHPLLMSMALPKNKPERKRQFNAMLLQ